MEKYSRWSDNLTGLNPFVPAVAPLPTSLPLKLLRILVGTLLCLVRLILGTAIFLLLMVVELLCTLLFFPLVYRILQRPLHAILIRLLLLILGVSIQEESANVRKLGLKARGGSSSKFSVKRGDVIVANHTSVIDVLYLASRFSPTFTIPVKDGDDKGMFQPCGMLRALHHVAKGPHEYSAKKKGKSVSEIARSAGAPVVVFPEGTTSNGKSVLQFLPVFEAVRDDLATLSGGTTSSLPEFHVICFRCENKGYSTAYSTPGMLRYLFWVCFQWSTTVKVVKLSSKDLPRFPPAASSGTTQTDPLGNSLPATAKEFGERLRSLLAQMLFSKTVELGEDDHRTFVEYWKHVQGGGKRSAADFTSRKAPHEHARANRAR